MMSEEEKLFPLNIEPKPKFYNGKKFAVWGPEHCLMYRKVELWKIFFFRRSHKIINKKSLKANLVSHSLISPDNAFSFQQQQRQRSEQEEGNCFDDGLFGCHWAHPDERRFVWKTEEENLLALFAVKDRNNFYTFTRLLFTVGVFLCFRKVFVWKS